MAFLNKTTKAQFSPYPGIKTLTMESLVTILFWFLKWYFLHLALKKKLPKQQYRWLHLPCLQSAHVTAVGLCTRSEPRRAAVESDGVLFSQLLSNKLFWIFLCWGKMIMLRKTKVLGNGTQLKPPSVMQSNAHLHPSPPRWCFNWRISKAVTWLLRSLPLVDVSHQC